MKQIGTLVLLVAAAMLVSGAANDLEVGSLALKDKDGNTRAHLAMVDGTPRLALFDKAGKTRARLAVMDGNPGLALFDKDGEARAHLIVFADGSPGLDLYDKDGQTRATLGVSRGVDKRTGAETKTAESTLTLFDGKGGVLWQAPR
ncbi:MAG: hypothetical protein O7C98_00705 [Planctomycetota bacterium]|nr:hypothetical protein [Planctomycetota bacterium]